MRFDGESELRREEDVLLVGRMPHVDEDTPLDVRLVHVVVHVTPAAVPHKMASK